MIPADVHAVHAPDRLQCVRCGRQGRAGGTFVCVDCLLDPRRKREQARAEAACGPGDGDTIRAFLVGRYHWAGGWPRIP